MPKTPKNAAIKTAARKTANAKPKASAKSKSTPSAAQTAAVAKTPVTKAKATDARRTPASTEVVMVLSHDEIAARAYQIWLANGRRAGEDEFNWHRAERELMRRVAA